MKAFAILAFVLPLVVMGEDGALVFFKSECSEDVSIWCNMENSR